MPTLSVVHVGLPVLPQLTHCARSAPGVWRDKHSRRN
jgi:hypothetical protein